MGAGKGKFQGYRAVLKGLMPVMVLFFHTATAQFAKSSPYFMDSTSDCYNAGYLLIGSDGVVNVNSRDPNSESSKIRQCTIRFRPEDIRHIIDVSFSQFSISDPGVTLHVDVARAGTHTLRAGDTKPPKLTSEGGVATISLTRTDNNANNYAFAIVIRVYKKDDGMPSSDDSPGPVGLIVGLIVGIIIFLVFLAILAVCCYRRKKEQYLANQHGRNFRGDGAKDTLSPSHSYGIDNAAQKETFPPRRDLEADGDFGNYSPRLKQKLINPPVNDFDYRDRSGSESDSKDPYIIGNYDRSPKKATSVKYEDDNPRRSTLEGAGPREYGYNDENSHQKPTQLSGSPRLNSRVNPRFRPERDAPQTRADNSDVDSGSDVSTKERFNKTSTSLSTDRQPPEKTPRKLKPLPPASKSPKPTAREEITPRNTRTQPQNTPPRSGKPQPQNSTRNSQPYPASSSSSETEHGYNGDDTYAEEKSPLSVSQEKPDTRHTLRPDRTKKKKTPEKPKPSPDSGRKEPRDSPDSKPAKSGKEKSKPNKAKSEKKTGSKQDAPEYEGRFKKADSARKNKSKAPRLGRSRSTGNALDDADSVGRGSVSSAGGYRAVPSVTADDYEDSDVESNYNPLRRSCSKTSLYASRSSLYGRRRRKNSVGESVYSFAYDDPDLFDRGSVGGRSLSRRHRGFKSLGDLEMESREQSARSTQTRSRKNSVSSTSGRSKSRDRKNSSASTTGRPKRAKSESELRRKVREAEEDGEVRTSGTGREKPPLKPKPRPKPKPRKSTTTVGDNDDDDDDDKNSTNTASTGVLVRGGAQPVMPVYAPQGYPGYMVGYPPQMPFVQAPGQPPVMLPYGAVPGVLVPNPGAVVPGAAFNPGAAALPPGAAVPRPSLSGPPVAPKPSQAKWDMLCRITDSAKEIDDASVAGSVFTN
ncbi:hypothetical protein ACOMHN_016303 [Nucella lapillus]